MAVTLLALATGSVALFFIGTSVAGAGFGGGFQGAIRSVAPMAEAHERAGVLSVLYVIAYVAMGLPAVLAGLRVVHGGGVFTTAREFGSAVMALAAVSLVGTLLRRAPVAVAVAVTAPAVPVSGATPLPEPEERAA